MACCEKCWRDAQGVAGLIDDVVETYHQMIAEREPCTPEEQAGEYAGRCPSCERITLHQHAGVCMAGCTPNEGA